MEECILPPIYRATLRFCYKATFFGLLIYLIFFLFVVFLVTRGWLDQDATILETGVYIIGGFIAVCVLVMMSFSVYYLWHLFRADKRKEALQGLVTFVFLNILTAYIWFYWFEFKHENIRFKLV